MANPLTVKAVESAIAEYDQIGRAAFLEKYGFRKARDYYLVVGNKNYDSKAIAGAAYGYLPGGTARTWNELIGGKNDAAAKLEDLGFSVTKPGQNADWTWDEHVLAMDLYRDIEGSRYNQNTKEIAELSRLLNLLGERRGIARGAKYRNRNGIYKKLMNFRAVDPDYEGDGLMNGNKFEGLVWEKYAHDRPGLRSAANAIKVAIEDPDVDFRTNSEPEYEAVEGDIVFRLHRSRERDQKLAQKKRDRVIAETGKLECEICEFDFFKRYGSRGDGFMEVHHINPIALSKPGRKTKLRDLVVVCSNCHRMLHRSGLIGVEALREMWTPHH